MGESSRRGIWKRNRRSTCDEASQNHYVTYSGIPKCAIKKETREDSAKKWQSQWEETKKGAITKEFFPNVERRLAVNSHLNPNVTTIMSGHGNIRSYLPTYLLHGAESFLRS